MILLLLNLLIGMRAVVREYIIMVEYICTVEPWGFQCHHTLAQTTCAKKYVC